MTDPEDSTPPEPPDTGLKQMMMWLLIAFVVTIIMTVIGVELAIRWFGP